jgi:hypothetical protein
MPKPCSICGDPRHDEIDRRTRIEKDIAKIAKEFSLSYPALYRHISANHHIREVTAIPTTSELSKSEDIYREISDLRVKAADLLSKAEIAGDLKTALLGIREARGCLELMAKIQGQIQERNINIYQQNILINNPEWIALRTKIIKALDPFLEAKEAVTLVIHGR